MSIKYREGYKYQLAEDYQVLISIKPKEFILTEYIRLDVDGALSIKKGYAWDGPSGPAVDTLNFMRGSLVHDALYQLMREEKLNHKNWRDDADRELKRICLEDGMFFLRAQWIYLGVRFGGEPAADPHNEKPTLEAP